MVLDEINAITLKVSICSSLHALSKGDHVIKQTGNYFSATSQVIEGTGNGNLIPRKIAGVLGNSSGVNFQDTLQNPLSVLVKRVKMRTARLWISYLSNMCVRGKITYAMSPMDVPNLLSQASSSYIWKSLIHRNASNP